jgi:hypothetical protein
MLTTTTVVLKKLKNLDKLKVKRYSRYFRKASKAPTKKHISAIVHYFLVSCSIKHKTKHRCIKYNSNTTTIALTNYFVLKRK